MAEFQPEPELTAGAFLAVDANNAAVCVDDVFANSQTQAASFLGVFIIHLLEAFKNPIDLIRWNTAPIVDNTKLCEVTLHESLNLNHGVRGREFDRIRNQVDENLDDTIAVCHHSDIAWFRL